MESRSASCQLSVVSKLRHIFGGGWDVLTLSLVSVRDDPELDGGIERSPLKD